MDELKNYQEICNIFISLAPNDEIRKKIELILYDGKYDNNYNAYSEIVNRDNPSIEGERRINMAYLLLRNPRTYDILTQTKVNLFHGTNISALPTILKYGLNSAKESKNNGIELSTGEVSTRNNDTRSFVSLTDVLDTAKEYSNLVQNKNKSSFGIIIGTTVNDAMQAGAFKVKSDVVEVGVRNKLPLENIRLIGVPSDKVSFVRKLVNNEVLQVVAIDDLEEKFYYIEPETSEIIIDYELLEKFKKDLKESPKNKKFGMGEIKELTLKRLLSKVKSKLVALNDIINGGLELNDDRRKTK